MKLHERMRMWAISPDGEPVTVPQEQMLQMARTAEKMHEDTHAACVEAYRLGKLDGYHYALALLDEISCGRDAMHARDAVLREITSLQQGLK